MKVEGKFVVVTGGANGIGEGLARRFAAEGARKVAVLDLDVGGAERVAAEIDGVAHRLDVSDEKATFDLFEQLVAEHGAIDLMVANAGIAIPGGIETSNAQWQRIWEVNVMSHVFAARAVLPAMIARGEGYILTVSSAAGLLTSLGAASYAVTKHAAVALAEWIAITHASQGIKVSCLCPMGVETDMINGFELAAKMLKPDAITVEELAEATIAGLEAERFLILPHPQVAKYSAFKATRHDDWITSMAEAQAGLGYVNAARPEARDLCGPTSRSVLSSYPEWREALDAAAPEEAVCLALAEVAPGAEVEVIVGAWCPDCVREITRFWAAIGDSPPFEVTYVALDRARSAGDLDISALEVEAVPTFIVRRVGAELGRIVESPVATVERDLLGLLAGTSTGKLSSTR